ncbi:uncharacterized protein LOC127536542 isoform X4 [Acanthochromis polyacanthus]|uniref:uncharacterized protein LOC127536542 isoform X4 n=1 Tax=Acanthochromis polyacanthus TaxID=80966 RepID=UPI0022348E14|nr:uncharacterized protein LOC127536542 isoform X4 [Acanthochromis polyacanthus]
MWFSDVLQVPIISRTAKLNTIQDSPSKGSVVVCMWQCKLCLVAVAGRLALLNHYKLKHPHLGRTSRYPCTFLECPCTFKTWNALHIHHSRDHSTNYKAVKALSVFKCHICSCKNLGNEREYFAHINAHLKKNEKVTCMFDGCDFHTSVYGTFRSHKSRRHASHSLTDFKPGIVTTNAPLPFELLPTDGQEDECVESDTVESANPEVLSSAIEKQLAAALLKLEYLVHVPDLKTLEDHGVYVPLLGTSLKGTVHSVVADNLGAHSIAGFIESFSGDYFCRFCTARSCEISSHCVASGVFNLRTKEEHAEHVQIAVENVTHHLAVKRECALTKNLSHFNVVTGYPPDIAHDIFEGIVPFELAYCLNFLIAKKFFTLDELNKAILSFPYKWSDKTNKPHAVPKSLSSRKSIGGNAHENWSLLRFLPFLIGSCVPQNEPAWVVLLDLKDITELVVAPVHTDESISYLESKIVEHRQRFQELFPTVRLLPKHHFLEHYPRLIRCFGPLLSVWTMRFEAKHKYFKQIVKHTSCFKNLPLTLASKHQFMIAFHISSPSYGKPCLDVPCVSTVPVDLLKDEVARAIHLKYPNTDEVNLAKNATYWGIAYSKGMIVAHGSACGLPEFAEIIQMCIIDGNLFVIVRVLCAWYIEHYRAFELRLSPAREVKLLALSELTDAYPLAAYMVGSSRMVTLKRHIHIKGWLLNVLALFIHNAFCVFWLYILKSSQFFPPLHSFIIFINFYVFTFDDLMHSDFPSFTL